MQITADSTKEAAAPQLSGRLVYENLPETLVGQMCQVIEMLGLRDTQEKATKDTVRNLIYESFLSERGCKYIEKDLMSVLETVLWKAKEHYQKNFVPIGHASYSLTMTIPDQEVQEAKSK